MLKTRINGVRYSISIGITRRFTATLQSVPKRIAARAFALAASISRSRGGAVVIMELSISCAAAATRSTARSNASSFAFEGRLKPDSLRTNWMEAARTSSDVAGGSKLKSVFILRHITLLFETYCLALDIVRQELYRVRDRLSDRKDD